MAANSDDLTYNQDWDIHIDLQFAQRTCSKTDCDKTDPSCKRCREDRSNYIKEPWEYCNPKFKVDTFLSLPFRKRDKFKAKLTEDERWHLDKELKRIEENRAIFTREDKKELLNDLKVARNEWKKEVIGNRISYVEEITREDVRSKKRGNPDQPRTYTPAQKKRYLDLLKRVETWQADDPPDPPTETRQASNVDGAKAGVMYFKKDNESSGWIGDNLTHLKCVGTFPNQKIPIQHLLEETDGNPISKRNKPDDTLRYFHLPSNHMHWVEVNPLYLSSELGR